MIIFEPTHRTLSQEEHRVLAIELARKIVPRGTFLSSEVDDRRVAILIQEGRDLISFVFHSGKMSEMDWKHVEKAQRENMTARIYSVAKGFEETIFAQVSEVQKRTFWFQWFLLQSDQETAVGVHSYQDSQEKLSPSAVDSKHSDFTGQSSFHQRLTTPEFVALSRLGMALRARRS